MCLQPGEKGLVRGKAASPALALLGVEQLFASFPFMKPKALKLHSDTQLYVKEGTFHFPMRCVSADAI